MKYVPQIFDYYYYHYYVAQSKS